MNVEFVFGGKGHEKYDCWIWWMALYTCASTRGKLKMKIGPNNVEKISNSDLEMIPWGIIPGGSVRFRDTVSPRLTFGPSRRVTF